jgi:hypothetical protein
MEMLPQVAFWALLLLGAYILLDLVGSARTGTILGSRRSPLMILAAAFLGKDTGPEEDLETMIAKGKIVRDPKASGTASGADLCP